ncbi:conserved Plasmodium protein, unknown function [Plasmodium vivax]|nr:unnamed protein product [Plasmodium vivax]CAI7719962.1 conserved Plasmodium protein, unknown function [Plasmodium vivax]SCO72208.1 conserved Plasmodium protein, unknown function [Plasmodium vivax]VUZ95193.1 conserved Plasmodium protein, unknown function [Plasmodium vivax]
MKVESNSSDLADPFAASQIIGDKLLQGWTLLNECCHMCMVTPLIKQKHKEERFCAKCNVYIRSESPEGGELPTNKGSSNVDGKKRVEGDCRRDDHLEGPHNLAAETNTTNVETHPDACTEKYPHASTYGDPLFEEKLSPVEFIKEIKLQHDEFNQILNRNSITKGEIENLLEVKQYVKERCGYDLGEWMNSGRSSLLKGTQMRSQKESQKESTHLSKNDVDPYVEDKKRDLLQNTEMKHPHGCMEGQSSQKREYLNDSTQRSPNLVISKENYFPTGGIDFDKYTNYRVDFMILDKAKDTFMQKLDKYVEQLGRCDSRSDERECISQVATVVDVLERVNNLRRNIHIVI